MTVSPVKLTRAVYEAGVPFKYAYLLTLALRFLPLILDELATINNAQKSRGYDIDRSNFIVRGFKMFPLMAPLIVLSLRRATTIALAMDLRAFCALPRRTFYVSVERRPVDSWIRWGSAAVAIFFVAHGVLGLAGQARGRAAGRDAGPECLWHAGRAAGKCPRQLAAGFRLAGEGQALLVPVRREDVMALAVRKGRDGAALVAVPGQLHLQHLRPEVAQHHGREGRPRLGIVHVQDRARGWVSGVVDDRPGLETPDHPGAGRGEG